MSDFATAPHHPPALPVIAGALARVFAPPAPLVPSAWMAENLVVPDGPRAGGRWDPALTPYLAEIVDCLGPDSPHNLAVLRKSAQTGASIGALGLLGAYIDRAPCRIGYALPTIDLLQDFNREKLTPTIEQTHALRERINPQTSRSATGSTTTSKRFPGGSLVLLNANSAPDLRSRTLKVGAADEIDEWADDLDGQGDPWDLFNDRFIAFHATGDYKILAASTPLVANASRIDSLFRQGDQRFWHVTCPGCGEAIVLVFAQLRFERKPPHHAHYVAQCCGTVIEHWQKTALVRAGGFRATNPEGLYPSFHVDVLMSQLTTWDKIAAEWIAAEGKERKEKRFWNTWLGLPYEVRGDAPDYQRLMERREDYPENTVPPLGLLLVAAADVQHNGLFVAVVAYGADKQRWVVTRRFLEGDTTDPTSGAFAQLAALYDETFPDAWGNPRRIDGMGVDAGDGGRANQVYLFCRGRERAHALKGVPGWGRPFIGTPTKVGIKVRGRVRGATLLWPVGSWELKAEFYADLRKAGRRDGHEQDPPGYVHFGGFCDENYFRQITAEYLADVRVRGRSSKVWRDTGPNHFLDVHVYADAIADKLGVNRMTREQWRALAQMKAPSLADGDLLAAASEAAAAQAIGVPETARAEFERAVAGRPEAGKSPARRRFARLKARRLN